MPATRDQHTAIHEAGHAIVGHQLGIAPTALTLHAAGGGICHCDKLMHQLASMDALAATALAGSLAEDRLLGKVMADPNRSDERQFNYFVDGSNLRRRGAIRTAGKLIDRHRGEIVTLAKWLLLRRSLDGALLQKLLAGPDASWSAL